ncbi:hypothetical protein IKE71_02535 [Candidatus Saccharibacteria bacterium]|nr:hypothetical protein [Candidatus Saccharibacteria bacterium]
MAKYYNSDPTSAAAIGRATRKPYKRREKAPKATSSPEWDKRQRSHYVEFALRSVLSEPLDRQVDALTKRLGTFAESGDVTDSEIKDFCIRLEIESRGRWRRGNVYEAYKNFVNYLKNGGSHGANNFIIPIIKQVC